MAMMAFVLAVFGALVLGVVIFATNKEESAPPQLVLVPREELENRAKKRIDSTK